MSEVLYRATKYMNAEDVLLAWEEKPKKRERQEDTRQDQRSKKETEGTKGAPGPRGKVHELHPINCPDRSNSDAD